MSLLCRLRSRYKTCIVRAALYLEHYNREDPEYGNEDL